MKRTLFVNASFSLIVVCILGIGVCTGTDFAAVGEVVINEFLPFASQGAASAVELYNQLAEARDVSGYILQIIVAEGERGPALSLAPNTEISGHGFVHVLLPPDFVSPRGGRLILLGPAGEIDDCHEYQYDSVSFDPFDPQTVGLVSLRVPDGEMWYDSMVPASSFGASNNNDGQLRHLLQRASPFFTNSSDAVASWTPGAFEVHMFDMGQADAMLVVFPSGYTVLIDAGEKDGFSSSKGAKSLADKIQQVIGKKSIDVGVISHLHLDHLGYVLYGGFYGLVEREGVTFGKIIDRNAGVWVDANKDGVCDSETEIQWNNVGTLSGTSKKWVCYATDPRTKIGAIRQVAQLCSTSQIKPPDNNAFVKIVTVDAIGATLKDKKTPINQDLSTLSIPPSENDYSIGLLIGLGDFRLATFGDLDGEYASSSYGYTYNHVEAAIAHRVGPVDVYHVNHHGSAHSSSVELVSVMKPQTSFFSCGIGNSYGHPAQEVVDRLDAHGQLFLTSDCDTSKKYPKGTVRANGNVVLRSTDYGKSYTVFDDAASNTVFKFQVTQKGAVPACP